MDAIFDACVDLLIYLADIFGVTYKEINVWIFCIVEPIVFTVMIWYIYILKRKLSKYRD
ncbi:MAG: hypothetical protein IPI50_08955 [Saprospiraceae bacterium]|nr:hypothetical protein [Saprospiraceae bacterium]